MVVLNVFEKNISTTYKSTILSKAALLVFALGILSIILPFIFAYKSGGFWLKRAIFYEQPDVKFKGEYIFVATTNNLSQPVITCSTLPYYQQVLSCLDHCTLLRVRESDKDFDHKVDELNLSLQVNLPENTQLTSVSIIIPLDYKLHDVCPLQMQAAIIYQGFIPIFVSKYLITGDAVVAQSHHVQCHKNHINNFYNYSVISTNQNLNEYDVDNIIAEYSERNLSLVLKNKYISFSIRKAQTFELKIQVRYPEDSIYFKPHFWQAIKWAWMQYFALYIITSWFIFKVKNYIFNRRLVLFYKVNPFKKKQ